MNQGTRGTNQGAVAASHKTNWQRRWHRGADIEVRILDSLIRQHIESDLLIGLAYREGLRDWGRRIPVGIAFLRRSDRALTGANDVHQCSRHRAVAAGREVDYQRGRDRGADIEVSIAKLPARQSIESDLLIGLANG